MANWAELPHDVLVEIVKRIKLYEDFVEFREVCSSWRRAAADNNFRFISNQTPWLMLPETLDSDLRSFYNLPRDACCQISLPEGNGKKCLSSKGWLMIIDTDCSINLVHPLSHHRINLPPIQAFEKWNSLNFILKYVLSTSPSSSSSDYTLMVIYGINQNLAYFKPGFKTWKTLRRGCYFDMTYYKGKFYAIHAFGEIIAFDIDGDDDGALLQFVETKQVAKLPPSPLDCLFKVYLVESADKLLAVLRQAVKLQDSGKTYAFHIFEIDVSSESESGRIKKVEKLGKRALFLGDNSSFSIEASEEEFGCKANCIYFTEDLLDSYYFVPSGGGKDMGIYNLEDGSIEPHYKGDSSCCNTPPIWVEKTFF